MPNQQYLNEISGSAITSGFKAIIDAINIFKDKSKTSDFAELRRSSISRASRDLVMSFPVICSDAVEPSTASLIVKALEKKDVSMLTLLFTSYHLKGNNGLQIMRNFHNNMNTNMIDVGEYMDYVDGLISDANRIKGNVSGVRAVASFFNHEGTLLTQREMDSVMIKSFLESLNEVYPDNNFSLTSLNEFYTLFDKDGLQVFKEDMNEERRRMEERIRKNIKKEVEDEVHHQEWDTNRRYQIQRDKQKDNFEGKKFAYQIARDKQATERQEKIENERNKIAKYKNELDNTQAIHNLIIKQLDINNAQKINELVPSYIVIRFYADDKDNPGSVQEFIAGVKANLYPVSSEEVIEQIVGLNNNSINNTFMKATTGESKFATDFLLATKQAKIDAIKNSKGSGNPIWRVLQGRAASNNVRNAALLRRSPAAAISTVVITDQEVDYLKMNYNIDITNPRRAIEFMRNYNLMCFVIVNEQTETARFLYDGDTSFINYSFSALDKDNRNKESDRKIVNLVSSAYR